MAIGRDTGPGEITVYYADINDPWFQSSDYVILHNFNFDGDELKQEHIKFLNQTLTPLLKGSGRKVLLEGYASQKGDVAYNQKLSERRVIAVSSYIKQQGVREDQIGRQAFGELKSTSSVEDDSRDRAVHIRILPDYMPKRPIPSVPKKPAPNIPEPPKKLPGSPSPTIIVPPIIFPDLPKMETTWREVQEIYMKIKWVEGGSALPNPSSRDTPFKPGMGKGGGANMPWSLLTERTTMGLAHFNAIREFTVEHKFRIATFEFLSLQNFTQQRLNVFVQVVNYTYTPPADTTSGPGFTIPRSAEDVIAIYSTGTWKEPPKR